MSVSMPLSYKVEGEQGRKRTGEAKRKSFIDQDILAQFQLSLFGIRPEEKIKDGGAAVLGGVYTLPVPFAHFVKPFRALLRPGR